MVLREMLAPGGRFATCCLAWHVCVVETCRTLALLAPVHSLATVNLSGSPLYNRNLALRRFVLNWVLNAKTLNFLHTHTLAGRVRAELGKWEEDDLGSRIEESNVTTFLLLLRQDAPKP